MNLFDWAEGAPTAPAIRPPSIPAKMPPTPSAPTKASSAPAKTPPYTLRPVRPMWRSGQPVLASDTGYVPHKDGDLRWLTYGYANGAPLGRWFRWSLMDDCWMWICIDHQDATGINAHPDTPPTLGGAAQ